MTCPDTSVIIPALASWHDEHDRARSALRRRSAVVAHCLVETYSVLTRLPEPVRAAPDVVVEALQRLFDQMRLLVPEDSRSVPPRLAAVGVQGGATYDGLIALTALDHGETLLTLDARAAATYRACGADFALIGA